MQMQMQTQQVYRAQHPSNIGPPGTVLQVQQIPIQSSQQPTHTIVVSQQQGQQLTVQNVAQQLPPLQGQQQQHQKQYLAVSQGTLIGQANVPMSQAQHQQMQASQSQQLQQQQQQHSQNQGNVSHPIQHSISTQNTAFQIQRIPSSPRPTGPGQQSGPNVQVITSV